MTISLAQSAKGKWPAMLPALGVSKDFLTGRHGPCPMCGGKDRFRFDNKDGRGTYYCSQCGSGDGIELVKRINGWEFKAAAREIEKHLGTAPVTPVRHGRPLDEVRREMNDIWRGGKPLDEVVPAATWWARRCGEVPSSTELRAVRSLRCPGAGDFAAIVARVMGADDKPVNLHRTYLGQDGQKAPIDEPRRVMDAPLPKGCAVRLSPFTQVLGVAEGLETAESCRLLFGVPTWALLTAENLKGFVPPPGVRKLVIYGDHDASFTGQAAAFELARKCWVIRKNYDPELEVEVKILGVTAAADNVGQDWNDALRAKLTQRVAA